MKKKEVEIYFHKEWKDMKTHLKVFLKGGQQEELHGFRVQVKKLRAFLTLSDSIQHCQKLTKLFKPVRIIFKQAGEIRNAYMNQKLGAAQQIDDVEFMRDQHQLQIKKSKKFKLKEGKFLEKLKSTHQILKQHLNSISDVDINLFYQTQLKQVASLFTKLKFNDRLHECRKLVKILTYNYKLTHKILDIGFNEDYLDKLQSTIGDWHDHVLAIALFSSDKVKNKTAVTNLKKQNRALKKQIVALTKDFYNRATTVGYDTKESFS